MFENGLQYVRSDFHLHTNKDKEFTYTGEQNSFVKDYVAALKKANISVGVITNHNKFDIDEYKAIRKAAKKQDILKIEDKIKHDIRNFTHAIATIRFNTSDIQVREVVVCTTFFCCDTYFWRSSLVIDFNEEA